SHPILNTASSSVAAGALEAMSHVSSLFVDVGNSPLLNVAWGDGWNALPAANAEVATSKTAMRTMSFLISSPHKLIYVAVLTGGMIHGASATASTFEFAGILSGPCRATSY